MIQKTFCRITEGLYALFVSCCLTGGCGEVTRELQIWTRSTIFKFQTSDVFRVLALHVGFRLRGYWAYGMSMWRHKAKFKAETFSYFISHSNLKFIGSWDEVQWSCCRCEEGDVVERPELNIDCPSGPKQWPLYRGGLWRESRQLLEVQLYNWPTSLASHPCFKLKEFSHECEAKDVWVLLFKLRRHLCKASMNTK